MKKGSETLAQADSASVLLRLSFDRHFHMGFDSRTVLKATAFTYIFYTTEIMTLDFEKTAGAVPGAVVLKMWSSGPWKSLELSRRAQEVSCWCLGRNQGNGAKFCSCVSMTCSQ